MAGNGSTSRKGFTEFRFGSVQASVGTGSHDSSALAKSTSSAFMAISCLTSLALRCRPSFSASL